MSALDARITPEPLTSADREFVAALRNCSSRAARHIAVELDTVSFAVRNGPPHPDLVADRIDEIGLDLLALASKQKAAA